ncbi:unnamed protein product [Adineta steineri]|uniref:Uncharacterized protein n=1 Tax=Adineta steineri TaxID=433720 RepID=A0A814RHW0_9BILA|nr:unnamed protein product [Adineta steineri]
MTAIFLYFLLIYFLVNSTTTATCNYTACNSQRIACSSNLDCNCFSLSSNSNIGICAVVTLSCTSVVRCNMDNVTCSIESTICVNSTRCGQPICYPLAMANKQICPPKSVTTTTLHTTTTGNAFCLANLKPIRAKYIQQAQPNLQQRVITTTTQKTTTTTKKLTTTTTQKPTTSTKISTTTLTPTGWFSTNNMTNGRYSHTASVLSNGKVLVTGGFLNEFSSFNGVELYDPLTSTWTTPSNMNNARGSHTASILSSGKVLVTGGLDDNYVTLNSAELY